MRRSFRAACLIAVAGLLAGCHDGYYTVGVGYAYPGYSVYPGYRHYNHHYGHHYAAPYRHHHHHYRPYCY